VAGPAELPGTETGGVADRGQILQEAIAKYARDKSLEEIRARISDIEQEYLNQDLDVYAIITVQGNIYPRLGTFQELYVPLQTDVSALPLPPGARPSILNPPPPGGARFRLTVIEKVLERGRPVRGRGF
jgi:hypothetical protein